MKTDYCHKVIIVLLTLVLLRSLHVFDTSAAVAGNASVSSWPMFHHDSQHTGQSSNNGPQTNNLKWSYTSNAGTNSPPDTPSISNDGLTLYVNITGNQGNQLIALSTDNGQVKWTHSLSNGGATAVASDGTIYAVGGNYLYAFTSSGTLKWTFSGATDYIHGEPCIGSDGVVYVGSWNTYVYAINPDGSLKWKYKTAGSIAPLASPTLSPDGGQVYVGSGDPHQLKDGTLYALKSSDGTVVWSKKIDNGRASGAVAGADGTVYACGSGRVYAFKPDGTQLWQSADGTAENLTPALSSSGIIYVGTGSTGMVYALNAANGKTLWSYQTGKNPSYPNGPEYGVLTAPVIGADSTVYVGAVDGKMYAIKSDGSLLMTYAASAGIAENCPALGSDGTLYFSASNNYLYAVKDPLSVPGAPTAVSTTAGNAQATVTFMAPESNGSSAITGYTVTSSPGGITATTEASPVTVTGLANGTAYTFTVKATNAVGTGPASSASNSVTPGSTGVSVGIQANGSATPITIKSSDSLTISVSLTSGSYLGISADWWFVEQTPSATLYSFDVSKSPWAFDTAGINAVMTANLYDFEYTPVYTVSGLPAGNYLFAFGVDLTPNGSLDVSTLTYSSVQITVTQ